MLLRGPVAVMLVLPCFATSAQPGVVSHIKVLSDKVEDVSSMEAWRKSFIREGMSDQEKGIAIWETVLKFRHQDSPPNEYLQSEINVHDAIKTFNVYGYGMCCCAASNIEALARYIGFEARGWSIYAHSVPEVYWDGAWHMLDASLLAYFPKADGSIASVAELVAGVRGWLDEHRDYRGNPGKLMEFMRNGGWRNGPEILSRCPFYDENGWLMAGTHGWYSTMQEFDCEPFIFEYGYSQGYQVNIQLRPGERLIRNWFNRGLHVNMMEGNSPGCLNTPVGTGDLAYARRYGDLAPGRIGNGVHIYEPPLGDPALAASALEYESLRCAAQSGGGPALQTAFADRPGVLTLRMPSSYVYLSGELSFRATVSPGGNIGVYYSGNHGLDWMQVMNVNRSGAQRLWLTPWVFRRYDYRLRFVMTGAGTGLDSLRVVHDIQHSQRALPALAQGSNTITFSAGPQEGTITIEGNTGVELAEGKQLVYTDFHPVLDGLDEQWMRVGESGRGTVTFPISAPGDMTRLRFGCHYRARDPRDFYDMQVSFDGGQSFRTVGRCEGPTQGRCKYVTVEDIPAGTRLALVRWYGEQRNTTCIFALRIDADYLEPNGGFRPVKITYIWSEGGEEKRHEHIARQPEETYEIVCAGEPLMKSITLELAE